jgi:hypothetical protein
MVYQASQSSAPAEFFEFQVPGDKAVYRMFYMQDLEVGAVELMSDPATFVAGGIAAAVDEPSKKALRSLRGNAFGELVKAWMSESQINAGESSAS